MAAKGKKAPKEQDEGLEDFYDNYPVTSETSCGYGVCGGSFLQLFANKKAYVLIYGLSGAFFNMSFSYFNGSISTIEKHFKIPSQTTGLIAVANDISLMLVSVFIAYYASKGHKPRWIAVGLLLLSAFCIMFALPHFVYGAPDALQFTQEYGVSATNQNLDAFVEAEKRKLLCNSNVTLATTCDPVENVWGPTAILFGAQLVAGVGAAIYSSLGVIYMDDNVKKSKSPFLLSEFDLPRRQMSDKISRCLSLDFDFHLPQVSPSSSG